MVHTIPDGESEKPKDLSVLSSMQEVPQEQEEHNVRSEDIKRRLANAQEQVFNKQKAGLDAQHQKVAAALLKAFNHAQKLLSSVELKEEVKWP